MKGLTILLLSIWGLWPNNNVSCGDLLSLYDQAAPYSLQFVDCERGTGQTIVKASYKVSGQNATAIENYLVQKYGMGPLHFVCCGWESRGGKEGQISSEKLKAINPNYHMSVSMYGSAEMKNSSGKDYIERDRNKIEFWVTVEILKI